VRRETLDVPVAEEKNVVPLHPVLQEGVVEEIDSKTNVRIGWVKGTDFSKVYGKREKKSKGV